MDDTLTVIVREEESGWYVCAETSGKGIRHNEKCHIVNVRYELGQIPTRERALSKAEEILGIFGERIGKASMVNESA